MRRVLCVWLPDWPLQRLFVAQPELRGRPVVLYHATHRGLRVFACSRRAARCGVVEGLSVAEARGLFQPPSADSNQKKTRPSSVPVGNGEVPCFLEHDQRADGKFLEQLAVWCQRFSPTVGLGQPLGNQRPGVVLDDTLLLDITGCAHLFHNEERLAEQVVEGFRQRKLQVRVAVADTIGAAWALSHFPPREVAANPQVVPAGKQAVWLENLPVAALRLDPDTLRILWELDLRTIGQLRVLPRASLPSHLGNQIVRRLDQAEGQVVEQLVPVHVAQQAEACQTFEYPICQHEALTIVLRQLLEQLIEQLQPRQEGVQRLHVRLDGAAGKNTQFSLGLVGPCASAAYLVTMALARLEQQRPPREVIGIQVRATATAPLTSRQTDLFHQPIDTARQKQFSQLIDRLNTRLGERTVLAVRLHADAQPERAFCWQPGGPVLSRPLAQPRPRTLDFFSARPLWLKRQPLPVTVLTALAEGPPIRFRWDRRDHQVVRCWGPERIETAWWRDRPVQRDYYRVETSRGQRFWLFRQAATGAWFLHGVF